MCLITYSQTNKKLLTIDNVIDTLSLVSSSAKIEKLNFQNDLLLFENYKKGLLPALSFTFNPISFNRSLRVLQEPSDGSYSYVEDYSNNSSMGVSVRQKIGLTGGELNIGSDLNYLNEFSRNQNSFSATPFTIGYSQQLWGGRKTHRWEKEIEYAKNQVAIKRYCTRISQIQQEASVLFMSTLFNKMESDLASQNRHVNDTLLNIGKIKLDNGHITEYDFKQIELQALNIQYASENATKKYIESQQRLITFLEIEYEGIDIVVPHFNLPTLIDSEVVASYVKKNNPFFVEQEIKRLESVKSFFTTKLSNRFNGNVSLNYGINQYAETLVEAYQHGNTRQSVMIGFQIPIFQWGINKNKIKIAENNYQANKLSIEKSVREFENEIKEIESNYNHSVKLWFTAERAYELSKEQYRMLVKKFSLGKVSVYELISAQDDQNSAMQRLYNAIRDVYNSYFSLRHMALYDFKNEKELEDVLLNNY